MEFFALFLLPILTELAVVSAYHCDCVDYYWRDFCGTIPEDAFIAGFNRNGQPRYVASVYIRNYELLPATLYPSGIAVTIAYDKVLNTTQNIRILCTPYPEALEWTPTEIKGGVYEYYNRNVIRGGHEVGKILDIGRITVGDELYVGKVFRSAQNNRGISYPNGSSPKNTLIFEVLRYNCEKVRCSNLGRAHCHVC